MVSRKWLGEEFEGNIFYVEKFRNCKFFEREYNDLDELKVI